jgi:hypothetical protein
MNLQSGKGTIQVVVRDSGGRPVPNAEVTLVMVDRAVLDLKPYDLQVWPCSPLLPSRPCADDCHLTLNGLLAQHQLTGNCWSTVEALPN